MSRVLSTPHRDAARAADCHLCRFAGEVRRPIVAGARDLGSVCATVRPAISILMRPDPSTASSFASSSAILTDVAPAADTASRSDSSRSARTLTAPSTAMASSTRRCQRDARRPGTAGQEVVPPAPGLGLAILSVPSFTPICMRRNCLRAPFDGDGFGAALDQRHISEAFDRDALERRKRVLLRISARRRLATFQQSVRPGPTPTAAASPMAAG